MSAPARPEPAPGTPAAPPSVAGSFLLFLLVGQSNMAGPAPVLPEDKIADPRILVLNREEQWVTQGEPVHYDRMNIGVGPGYTFAKLLAAKNPGTTIGLIPCCFGATTVQLWDPSSTDMTRYAPENLYNHAVRRARLAMKAGKLTGILWHQGEANAESESVAGNYIATLTQLARHFRRDLNDPHVPFVAGEIGYFTYPTHPAAEKINREIMSLPTLLSRCAVVSADGLTDMGDHLHFDNASQKEMARRYLNAFLRAQASPVTA